MPCRKYNFTASSINPQMLSSISFGLVCPASAGLSTGRRVTRHEVTGKPTDVANNIFEEPVLQTQSLSPTRKPGLAAGFGGFRSSLSLCRGAGDGDWIHTRSQGSTSSPSDAVPMSLSCGVFFCISNPGIPRRDQVHYGCSTQWGNVEERYLFFFNVRAVRLHP